ncbi:hypothetical protein [uncultured Rhodoblastus sp.]|uniref:hypothetical protein n=1 Tax=uncultured Rhodoblastus sp. TaxID=543037 RepID=UPI0025D85F37|nr:hypothetical protein [uncultured Rhodoblastus sp.]
MTQFSLAFAPLAPLWLLGVFAALALAAVAAALILRRRGALLRALVFTLLLGALSGPSLVEEQRENLHDVVAVVLDRSASQDFGDRRAQTDAARDALDRQLKALGDVDIRLIEAGAAPLSAELADAGQGDGTRLFAALNAGLADVASERLGAVIMVTDGVVHDIPSSLAGANLRAPLHVLVTGHEGERDRHIVLVEAPRFGLIGKEVAFTLKVEETNGPGDPVAVTVKRDGAVTTRVLARPGEPVKIPVRLDHGGQNVLEFDAEPMADELTLVNNKAVATVEGVRDHLKVLLVSGEPNPGERAWRNLLKADANVELVHFTILRPPEKQDGTPIRELALIAFPTAELFGARIGDFDLILFDRYSNMGLLPPAYFDNIVRYVRDGGALAIVAGPNFAQPDGLYYTPIGKVIPARPTGEAIETPFQPALSQLGARHPVTRDLPGAGARPAVWSPWFRQEQAVFMRGAPVLEGDGGAPLLVLSREGKGRVALLLTDQSWLWSRGYRGGGPYDDLMRRMSHWLMKEPELEEEFLHATARGREVSVERQTLAETVATVHVAAPSGKHFDVALTQAAPGLFRGKLSAEELGLYRLSQRDSAAVELTALVNVGPENPLEYREVVSTTEKLRPLAEAGGGSARRIGEASGSAIRLPRIVAMRDSPVYAGQDYIGVRRTGASVARGIRLAPLAVGLFGLLALLGALVGAWAWEGRRGRAG